MLRFDVIQDEADAAHVVLVEVYRDADAAAAHKLTPHYAAWRDAVADMMAEPRASVRFSAVFPPAARAGRAARDDGGGCGFATAGRIVAGHGRAAELPACWPDSGHACWCDRGEPSASREPAGGPGMQAMVFV